MSENVRPVAELILKAKELDSKLNAEEKKELEVFFEDLEKE